MAGGKAASLDRFARQQAVGSPIIITTPNPTRLEKTQPFCACEKQVLPSPLSLITAHGKKWKKDSTSTTDFIGSTSVPRPGTTVRSGAMPFVGGAATSHRFAWVLSPLGIANALF